MLTRVGLGIHGQVALAVDSMPALHPRFLGITQERSEGIIVALVAPGMVQTQLLADSGYRGKALTPAESAADVAEIIANLTLDDKGKPTNVDGAIIPW